MNKLRENNAQFLQSRSTSSRKDFSSYIDLSVDALRNNALERLLFVQYGNRC